MATPIGWGLTASVSGKTLADQAAAPKTSVQSIRLGFLATGRFAMETTFLGYWISLDSLVRIEPFQWLMLNFRWKFLPRGFSPSRGAGTEACGRGRAEAPE
jgi:hypothetical protein